MNKNILLILILWNSLTLTAQNKFLWGVASASYQVEGAYTKDGKSLSNWDVYTNKYNITKSFVGVNHTGNEAVNMYNRSQYLQDIALMKKLGVNCYRFSLSWSRILPNGIGKVNQKGVQHYHQFIDDLLANNITPFITLYHWDMPNVLQEKGGFNNPNMVKWYSNYANVVFKEYGKKVKHFITFNEPNIDLFLFTNWANNVINKKENPFKISTKDLANKGMAAHHLMLANAIVTKNYHNLNLGGQIGITLSLIPTEPKDVSKGDDQEASQLQDGIHNRFFLDASLKGTYPTDVINLYKKYNKDFKISDSDLKILKNAKPDFIGVNYYGISYVSRDTNFAMNINWITNNPDTVPMFNGAVRPKHFYDLLMRLKNDYNNPVIYITENGAGYGDADEQLINDTVNDNLRTNYITTHIDAALKAKIDGANLQGYMLWSILDNFEWTSGYTKRFGLVFVDFKTQKRTPKKSCYTYKDIINNSKF